jgi:transcriptional regulator of acetoin/glycerol metabolism
VPVSNGTWLNGVRVNDAPLEDGDVLRVGDSVGLVMRIDAALVRSGQLFETPLPGIVVGPRSRDTWQRLVEISKARLPVILEGATGTGKEMFARALHELSGRSGAFVGVNCAALPETLVEARAKASRACSSSPASRCSSARS